MPCKILADLFSKKGFRHAEQERQGCLQLPHLLFSRQGREHRFCMTTSNQQQGRVTCAKDRYCRMIDGAHHWDYKINDNFGLSTARSYAMHPGQSWSHHAKVSLTKHLTSTYILLLFQIMSPIFLSYIVFTIHVNIHYFRYITELMYLQKQKRLTIQNGGSINLCVQSVSPVNLRLTKTDL